MAGGASTNIQADIEALDRVIESLGRGLDLESRSKIKLLKSTADAMKSFVMAGEVVYGLCNATEDLI
jgi:hypothetical protein